LIFNADSGKPGDSSLQLVSILVISILVISILAELNMISYAMLPQPGSTENTGVQHYRAKHATIHSLPHMLVLFDGILPGEGPMSVHAHPGALAVMTGTVLTGSHAR
jgi:diacylglycerol kinase family enzyme